MGHHRRRKQARISVDTSLENSPGLTTTFKKLFGRGMNSPMVYCSLTTCWSWWRLMVSPKTHSILPVRQLTNSQTCSRTDLLPSTLSRSSLRAVRCTSGLASWATQIALHHLLPLPRRVFPLRLFLFLLFQLLLPSHCLRQRLSTPHRIRSVNRGIPFPRFPRFPSRRISSHRPPPHSRFRREDPPDSQYATEGR